MQKKVRQIFQPAFFCAWGCLPGIVFILPLLSLAQPERDFQEDFLIIAHRGAWAYAPENTLAALRLAMEMGANALEIDVRQTKDGHVVALHDAKVDRTTDGRGKVEEFTLAQLKLLDAGSWFSEAFRGEAIPTLEEVIDILYDDITLIIELKGSYPEFEAQIIELVRSRGVEDQVILKSFKRHQLRKIRRLAPELPLIYVYILRIPWLGLTVDLGVSFRSVLLRRMSSMCKRTGNF